MAFENKEDRFKGMLQVSDNNQKSVSELQSFIPKKKKKSKKKTFAFSLKESTHLKLNYLAKQNNYQSTSSFLDDLIDNLVSHDVLM